MPTLDEIRRAGLSPTPTSSSDQVLAGITQALAGGFQGYQAGQEERRKKQQEMYNFYNTLRTNGYEADEATAKVNETFSGFFTHANFKKPTNDVFKTQQEKSAAELEKIKAETKLSESKSEYYRQGGPKRSVIDKMTPAQLQQRLKYLDTLLVEPETPEELIITEEKDKINEKLRALSGITVPNQESSALASAGSRATAGRVRMQRPDGTIVDVASKDVQKAIAKGYKPR